MERVFFPWVVGRVLNDLVNQDRVRIVHAPGRKGRMGTPVNFYMDPAVNYEDVLKIILRKRKVTAYINSQLTRLSPAGFHAEDVFERAFISLRFKIHDRDVSEFRGKKVEGRPGKELPNLDFIIEKNRLIYGVDIKNWIKYEFDSIHEVMGKVDLAIQLDVIPFMCVRYVDKDTLYRIIEMGGIVYSYETLLLPPEFESLAKIARELIGYPILATDVLPTYKLDFINKLHNIKLKKSRERAKQT